MDLSLTTCPYSLFTSLVSRRKVKKLVSLYTILFSGFILGFICRSSFEEKELGEKRGHS